ncbi:MAG: polyprenyl diphosphate synthase [Clostridia bacterium]
MNKIPENGPKHIAIILDGNRRWAKEKGLPASMGHKEGGKNLRKIINYAYEIGVEYLTVYAFSTENWKREASEVDTLLKLLYEYTEEEIKNNSDKDICIKVYGDESRLDEKTKKNLDIIEQKTKNRRKLTFGICFNYGGRDEIVRAIKNIAIEVKKGNLKIENIDTDLVSNNLYTAGVPDPDLVIRTSKEYRTSNFLPWQIVYSELYFSDGVFWPDFNEAELDKAIEEYMKRNRRFGN